MLKHGYPCLSLHWGKDQTDRESTISDFKSNVCNLLVATSIDARGLDVKELELVINYDAPNHYEDYVHCVGMVLKAYLVLKVYVNVASIEEQYWLVLRTVLMVDSITFGQEMVNVLVSGKEYDKVFNHLDMLNAPLEGKASKGCEGFPKASLKTPSTAFSFKYGRNEPSEISTTTWNILDLVVAAENMKLQDKIKDSKSILKYGVCFDRLKDSDHSYDDSCYRDVENFEALDYEDAHLG
ncbi:DEAD-box ATP-dependent RNA helicase 42 [Tanacetum coccineum]